jgi:hypothetical protein
VFVVSRLFLNMCCLLSSFFQESLKFCSSFLICDGGIVSCFSAETRWATMLGGPKNQRESPNTS